VWTERGIGCDFHLYELICHSGVGSSVMYLSRTKNVSQLGEEQSSPVAKVRCDNSSHQNTTLTRYAPPLMPPLIGRKVRSRHGQAASSTKVSRSKEQQMDGATTMARHEEGGHQR